MNELTASSSDISLVYPLNKLEQDLTETALIRADSDLEFQSIWLSSFQSTNTIQAAKKEVGRFNLWLAWKGMDIRSLRYEDCLDYVSFLSDPQPTDLWIGKKQRKFMSNGILNDNWRPFEGPLSPKSKKLSVSIVKSMYSFAFKSSYIQADPWSLIKLSSTGDPTTSRRVKRLIPKASRDILFAFLATLSNNGEPSDYESARSIWIIDLLLHTGARRSETCGLTMNSLWKDEDGLWWLNITGKGNTNQDIPCTSKLMESLAVYRKFLKLPPYPTSLIFDRETPLVGKLDDPQKPLKPVAFWKTVKGILGRAADFAIESGYPLDAVEPLRRATTHWFRHTSASVQVNDLALPLSMVRDNLRHSNISTTSNYLNSENKERNLRLKNLDF